VAIARAIITEPEVLLYDSPTGGLDPVTSNTIVELIMKQRDVAKTSALMVTHRLQDAFTMRLTNSIKPQSDGGSAERPTRRSRDELSDTEGRQGHLRCDAHELAASRDEYIRNISRSDCRGQSSIAEVVCVRGVVSAQSSFSLFFFPFPARCRIFVMRSRNPPFMLGRDRLPLRQIFAQMVRGGESVFPALVALWLQQIELPDRIRNLTLAREQAHRAPGFQLAKNRRRVARRCGDPSASAGRGNALA